jgi:hypothetical protein
LRRKSSRRSLVPLLKLPKRLPKKRAIGLEYNTGKRLKDSVVA